MGCGEKMHKQSDKENYSHRKHTKVIMVEGINPITTKKTKIELRILAAMDSCCFSLARPRQNSIADTWAQIPQEIRIARQNHKVNCFH